MTSRNSLLSYTVLTLEQLQIGIEFPINLQVLQRRLSFPKIKQKKNVSKSFSEDGQITCH